jgi:hypothetical protein
MPPRPTALVTNATGFAGPPAVAALTGAVIDVAGGWPFGPPRPGA